MIITHSQISKIADKCIPVLCNAQQTLVWLNSEICYLRGWAGPAIIPESTGDVVAHKVARELKRRGIVESYGCFTSYAEIPAFLYVDTFTLTEDFFQRHCQAGKQLKLF